MKAFNEFMCEGNTIPAESLAKHVQVSDNLADDGYTGVIAAFEQAKSNKPQLVFKAHDGDIKEFGKGLPANEVVVRVSTPLTTNRNTENRVVARLNATTGKLRWLDVAAYDNGKVIWERPLKLKFLTISEKSAKYFNIF